MKNGCIQEENFDWLIAILRHYKNNLEEATILDFGCGQGEILLNLKQQGFNVYGVDILDKQVVKARKMLADNNYEPSIVRLIETEREIYKIHSRYTIPFEDNFFNVIYCFSVFEHIADLETVLKELQRVLKPGGFIYTLYPGSYPIIEPHLRLPFVHFIPYSKFRMFYIAAFYKLQIGEGRAVGAVYQNEYLKKGVFYPSHRKQERLFSKYFQVENIIHFHLEVRLRTLHIDSVFRFIKWLVTKTTTPKETYNPTVFFKFLLFISLPYKNLISRSFILKK